MVRSVIILGLRPCGPDSKVLMIVCCLDGCSSSAGRLLASEYGKLLRADLLVKDHTH